MTDILHALLAHDQGALSQPGMEWGIYGILFAAIFLESALLAAALLPGDSLLLLAGLSELRQGRFLCYSWTGAFLWIGTLMMAGEPLTTLPFFLQHESAGMTLLLVLPLLLLVVGVAGSLITVYCRRNKRPIE